MKSISNLTQTAIAVLFSTLTLAIYPNPILAQPSPPTNEEIPIFLKRQLSPRTFKANHIKKKPGHYSASDWAAIIDSTWGQGLPVNEKLQIFDTFWDRIDQEFACFQGIDDNWDSLRTVYRNEIQDTVTRGRFAAIMNYLALDLRESHTYCIDKLVNWDTDLDPGIPLLVVGVWGGNNHFGAGLTPLPDSSLLVYDVRPNHQLGLVRGDIVLGYDGVPWKVLYKELLNAQLPIASGWWGSSESSYTHSMLMSAGMNWHLFDTIDIVKFNTGDTIHLSTQPLINQYGSIFCTEQLDIPGVPKPDYNGQQLFSYGIIDNTQIGYIYGWGWFWNAESEFYNAVYDLMFNYETDGLIIDFRTNFGGNMFLSNPALSLLFNQHVTTIGFAQRNDPNDHLSMIQAVPPSVYVIPGDSSTFYDKPIAVLTGPGALSSGDQVALRMKFHPMARVFGKSTATAFNAPTSITFTNPDWESQFGAFDAFLASDPQNYLTHDEFQVDESVWLTPEDVAQGEDTVVKAAKNWILSHYPFYINHVSTQPPYVKPAVDSVLINANVENLQSYNIVVSAQVTSIDSIFSDSLQLFDDGNHGDQAANDGIWGNHYQAPQAENLYKIRATAVDLDSGIVYAYNSNSEFTTIGPVVVDHFEIPQHGPTGFTLRLYLKNDGLIATATAVSAEVSTSDTNVTGIANNNQNFGNIAPGQVQGSLPHTIFTQNIPDTMDFVVRIFSNGYFFWSDSFKINITGIAEDENTIPLNYSLRQSYPNPFNPTTTIAYQVPWQSDVRVEIYNTLGQKVRTIINDRKEPGTYQTVWDGRNDGGAQVGSGVYLYRMVAGDFVQVRKMILMK